MSDGISNHEGGLKKYKSILFSKEFWFWNEYIHKIITALQKFILKSANYNSFTSEGNQKLCVCVLGGGGDGGGGGWTKQVSDTNARQGNYPQTDSKA